MSKKTSPNRPKHKPIIMNIPKILDGLFDVNKATMAVIINIKDTKPLKITAVTLFSLTRKNKKTASKITPTIRGINQ